MQAVLFLQRVAAFSPSIKRQLRRGKRLLHLRVSLPLSVVPISHKTVGAFPCPLDQGKRVPSPLGFPRGVSPYLDPIWPLQAPLPAALFFCLPGDRYQFPNAASCSLQDGQMPCSVRSWEKQIGEAVCSVDLNRDVGDFLPVGPSAQGFTPPERTG